MVFFVDTQWDHQHDSHRCFKTIFSNLVNKKCQHIDIAHVKYDEWTVGGVNALDTLVKVYDS